MKPLKVIIVAGARPNFMKVAPLIHCIRRHNTRGLNGAPDVDMRLVHTGQHYDAKMSEVFFAELDIPEPHVNLEVGSGSHAVQTASVMLKFEPVCVSEKPDWVVVVGDVNSTLACTLVASKLGIKVAHVEAGLRSFDRAMPEELNRLATDALADLLLTPSEDADENLRREGIPQSRIRLVGNVMIDSLVANIEKSEKAKTLQKLGINKNEFLYVTLHRPSNVDRRESLIPIVEALQRVSRDVPVVFPMHPRTKARLSEFGCDFNNNKANIKILEPVGYHDSLALTRHARCVVTDSGGLQEESTYFRTPCLTLRENTERPVTIQVGSNRLSNPLLLDGDLKKIFELPERFGQVPKFWDGKASERVLASLIEPARHSAARTFELPGGTKTTAARKLLPVRKRVVIPSRSPRAEVEV
jgi:UDP-N-acetylglucosamine 2-epimerase (non-hydrolysing)